MSKNTTLLSFAGAVLAGLGSLYAALPKVPIKTLDESKPPAFKEAEESMKAFKIPKGLKMSVWAAEPQLVSPVAMTTDEHGRLFVVETWRAWGNGGLDMREFPSEWYDDDLAARTVEDRVAWITKRAGADAKNLTLDSERVRLIEDKAGTGKADSAVTFSDGYNAPEDGVAAGILARKGSVYLANIPSLYELKDSTGSGRADVKKVMSTGYGVHYQLIGHDLHGLRMGPDGKLYYSIGDRGCHVTTKEGKILDNPDSGVVFRCDPDGSNLEMVATGLRNPQELAFDQYGNLFTADNNCDYGDSARWVYVVEGGETGWRVGYQFIKEPNGAGPWMAENLWHLESEHPAAWCLPPVAYAGPGPSGIGYYPGTGLGDQYKDHFFMTDFHGAATGSGVWSVQFKPRGATFEATEKTKMVWNILATDVEFAVDGGLYISDWVNGWFRPMKGRIWKVTNPEADQKMLAEVKGLIADGMEKRPVEELSKLLAHVDQRVRLEAQYELANRGEASVGALQKRLGEDNEQLARIHAIWGLGQISRKKADVLGAVVKLLDDPDSEIRAQAAKTLGDAKFAGAYDGLVKHLKDEVLRVRFFAAMGVGKFAKLDSAGRIVEFIRENNDRDVYVRHAGVMALKWIGNKDVIEQAAKDESAAVRLAALLVMRRNMDAGIARFLDDASPALVEEAARAISDEAIAGGTAKLATTLERKNPSRVIWLRAIAANLRVGAAENAARLAKFAAEETNSEDGRVEALWALSNWATPPKRDRVMGLWRPIEAHDQQLAVDALKPVIGRLAMTGPGKLRVSAIELIRKFGIEKEQLAGIVKSKDAPVEARAAALKALEELKMPEVNEVLPIAFEQGVNTPLRKEAISVYLRMPDAAAKVAALFKGASPADRKSILESLGTAGGGVGDSVIEQSMDTLLDGSLPAGLQLDVLEAARKSKSKAVAEKVKMFDGKRDAKDTIGQFSEALEGGDAARGKKIFFESEKAQCVRCHKIGTDNEVVGPDLMGVATRKDRRYLLESIVSPNAQIAPGFESVILKLKGNVTMGGIVKKETDKAVFLVDPNGGVEEVDKDDIVSRAKGLSAMPEDLAKQLSKREIRDLVEFLGTLKEGVKIEPAGGHGK